MHAIILYLIPRSYELPKYNHGISSISAALKSEGCSTSLLGLKDFKQGHLDSRIEAESPDLILISYSSNKRSLAVEVCTHLSSCHEGIPVVVGGIHPTSDPADAASMPGVSAACKGAGEMPLKTVVHRLELGVKDFSGIPNLYIASDGLVCTPADTWSYKYSPGDPILYDNDLFDLPEEIRHTGRLAFMAGRGCVFRCSYCIHSVAPEAFQPYSVDAVISHISSTIAAAGRPPRISFHDDLFPTAKNWLEEFCSRYAEEIGIPFYCQMTATSISDRVCSALKSAGCYEIRMGVESGCEERRYRVLNKRIPNQRFLTARETLARHDMRAITLFLIGAPYETHETAEDVFSFTRELGPDETRLSIFQPYPGSALYDECISNGWIDGYEYADSLYEPPGGSIPFLSPSELVAHHQAYEHEFDISSEA